MVKGENFKDVDEDMKILSGDDGVIEFDVDMEGDWDEDWSKLFLILFFWWIIGSHYVRVDLILELLEISTIR